MCEGRCEADDNYDTHIGYISAMIYGLGIHMPCTIDPAPVVIVEFGLKTLPPTHCAYKCAEESKAAQLRQSGARGGGDPARAAKPAILHVGLQVVS